jgi:hypothetical protein
VPGAGYPPEPPLHELQLVAEQDEQLLVPAACTVPSELPKEHTEISRCTSGPLHSGQRTSASLRITSFSNLLSQDWQENS